MPTQTSLDNLKPAKPGDVRNPQGRNQYTYRRVFEDAVEKLLVESDETEPDKSRAQVLAETAISMAKGKDGKLMTEVLRRLWPELSKHEITGPDGGAITCRWETDADDGD